MGFLYILEQIRDPFLNKIFLAVTTLGEETAFLVLGLILYWCFSKRSGYYLMSVGFLGTITSQAMKIACRVPRPWVKDPSFTILEEAREAAGGYSFPSGHTQSAVGTFGAIAKTVEDDYIRFGCIMLSVLVAFSRMYVGVHTPADVIVGAAISIVFIFALHPLMMGKKDRTFPVLIALSVISLGYLIVMECVSFPADIDTHNLESAMKNAYTLVGATVGLAVVYPLEKKYVNFEESALWWVQIIKIVLGLSVVLAVKEGLRTPLDWMFGGHLAARAVRYFLIVIVAGLLWPMTFRFFSRLGTKKDKEG